MLLMPPETNLAVHAKQIPTRFVSHVFSFKTVWGTSLPELSSGCTWKSAGDAHLIRQRCNPVRHSPGVEVVDDLVEQRCVGDGLVGQAVLMRRCSRRVPAPRSGFAGFRFPPEVIMVAVRWYLATACPTATWRSYWPNARSRWIT